MIHDTKTIVLLGLVACGGSDGIGGGNGGEAWWNVSTTEPWNGTDEPGGEDDDDDEEFDEEGPERIVFGEFTLANGQPTNGFFGYFWTLGADQTPCDFEMQTTVTGPVTCDDCTWAVAVSFDGGEVFASEGNCEPFISWRNATAEFAMRGETVGYRTDSSTAWDFGGFAETEGSAVFFERELDGEE
ncbi:MAG: hypothetical protein AAGA48_26405 [Myxococcota bacterium]